MIDLKDQHSQQIDLLSYTHSFVFGLIATDARPTKKLVCDSNNNILEENEEQTRRRKLGCKLPLSTRSGVWRFCHCEVDRLAACKSWPTLSSLPVAKRLRKWRKRNIPILIKSALHSPLQKCFSNIRNSSQIVRMTGETCTVLLRGSECLPDLAPQTRNHVDAHYTRRADWLRGDHAVVFDWQLRWEWIGLFRWALCEIEHSCLCVS